MFPRPAEPLEAPHEWSVEHPGLQVHRHQLRCGPLAAARGHPGAGAELDHDVPQRARGLQDVVASAVTGICASSAGDCTTVTSGQPSPAMRSRATAAISGDSSIPTTPLCGPTFSPSKPEHSPVPGPHVQDHLPPADRERLADRPAVGLERARPAIAGAGMLAVARLPRGPPVRPMRRRGNTRLVHDPVPVERHLLTCSRRHLQPDPKHP